MKGARKSPHYQVTFFDHVSRYSLLYNIFFFLLAIFNEIFLLDTRFSRDNMRTVDIWWSVNVACDW